jgi:hypothetical protein
MKAMNAVDLLTGPQVAALERVVRKLQIERPGGKVRLHALALEVAALPSEALAHVGLDQPDPGAGPPHAAAQYVEILLRPTIDHALEHPLDAAAQRGARRAVVEIDWYRGHRTSDPTPSEADFDRLAENFVVETPDAPAGVRGHSDGSRPYSATPDGAVAYRPPVVRRRASP